MQSHNRIAWRFRPASTSRPIVPLRNCVAIDDQNRIIAALGTEVYLLVPGATGCEVAWRFAAADHIPGSPVIGANGLTYVHSGDGLLHALDVDGSSARTPTKVGAALGWATPLVDDAGRTWISPATGGLIRVDESGQTTARPFWRHPSRLDCTGAILGHVLYIGGEDQYLHAVDLQAERGRDLWNQQDKIGLTGWYINSAIAVDGESRIIAVSRDDTMYSFDVDGRAVWTTPLNGRAIGSPVIADNGTVIIGLTTQGHGTESLTGRLIGVQQSSGRLAWSIDLESPVESTPVVGDAGEVYFGDNAGRIHAVTIQGRRIWSEQVGAAVRSAGTILSIGQVVFGADDGSLVSLRCASQSIGGGWPKLLGAVTNR
jgi:outer membrane protein assembly factor BamB